VRSVTRGAAGLSTWPSRFVHSDVQLAITVLEVTLERPSPMPGSRAITSMPACVRVAIPTSHEHAGALYRADNRVSVEGKPTIP
jgi:hypothetical protein